MEIESSNLSYLEEKIDSDGAKENIIVLECQKCPYFKQNTKFKENCVLCFLNIIKKYKNLKICTLLFNYGDKIFASSHIEDLKLYFLNQDKFIKVWAKIKSFKKCSYEEFDCKIITSLKLIILDLNNFFDDPTQFYDKIYEIKEKLKIREIYDKNCQNCLINLKSHLDKISNYLNKFQIIKKYTEFTISSNSNEKIEFYQQLLQKETVLSVKSFQDTNQQNYKKVSSYFIGSKEEFEIEIFEIPYESERLYKFNMNLSQKLNERYIRRLLVDININFDLLNINEIIAFEDLVKIYRKKALNYIKNKYNFSNSEANRIASYASLKRINLFKIFPFLIDNYVEEIFLDSPNEKIYLNHQLFGRCKTKISFNNVEIERLKTFLRIYSKKRLDYSSPSNKMVIKNKFFYCRFAIDVSPIALNGFALDIRKLNKNIMTIQDLLKNGTLNPKMAAFLYFSILRRVNITVTGETNTGKTTLINALDLIAPKEFRKIYIEDINESLNQIQYGRHQLKFRVDSVDNPNQKFSKQNQIKMLLHRTPDIIYLGEILTINEAKAMFHCLAAGLKGFQTIHASDIESLINRFLYHFKIEKNCLSDLNLIVLMKNYNNQRKIASISEIDKDNTHICSIFSYNPQSNTHNVDSNLFYLKNIDNLKKYENISEELFFFILNIYEDIFTTLNKIDKITNKELVRLFDTLSYFSLHSYQKIEDFWLAWKRRNLNSLN